MSEVRGECPGGCGAPEPYCDCWEGETWPDADARCSRCDDGWRECPDPMECTRAHNAFGECRCSSCGGSGLAKDQTVW
jgi:hypothetical protein